ncbi:MAG: pyrroline-5-carboxylate reductase [Deltaproteobacteria bacterium]|nr:pyrroline-5-carboxylate reductase [Deltaproteobacteria bacterium]MBI3293651.1 pyrroline-5-carboxylate reductase [Deltaproteobacteria bacterium]
MGRCLVQGLLDSKTLKPSQILFMTRHVETAQRVAKELGIHRARDNADLVKRCDLILLAVKPQNGADVLAEMAACDLKGKTVISIMASFSTVQIQLLLNQPVAIVRAMPNTPAFVRAGITAFCLGAHAKEKDALRAVQLFSPVGAHVRVDEKQMDAVTGLSGCGPAYVYVVLESLTDGGIKVGLPRDLAIQLAAHTVLGSAKMLLETGRHPAALKDEVTTPAGCTIDGLMELEEGKLRVTLIKAIVQATRRANRLARR